MMNMGTVLCSASLEINLLIFEAPYPRCRAVLSLPGCPWELLKFLENTDTSNNSDILTIPSSQLCPVLLNPSKSRIMQEWCKLLKFYGLGNVAQIYSQKSPFIFDSNDMKMSFKMYSNFGEET